MELKILVWDKCVSVSEILVKLYGYNISVKLATIREQGILIRRRLIFNESLWLELK